MCVYLWLYYRLRLSVQEVELLFKHEKCPKVVNCEFAHNGYWYVTFNTDEEAAAAYSYLREYGVKFRDKPVLVSVGLDCLVLSFF